MTQILLVSSVLVGTGVVSFAAEPIRPTYYRDIVPILQQHCQSCHRPGEIGPMALGSYNEVRPWAKAIKEAVRTRKMPPWFAEKGTGHFVNDPSLSPDDISKLAAWADTGAVEGNPKESPGSRAFVEGWNIGTPDAVFEMPEEYSVPAAGTIEYTYLIVPSGFREDRWIAGAEVRPGNRSVVHHVQIFIREPGSPWLRDYPIGKAFVPKEQIRTDESVRPVVATTAGAGVLDQVIAGYVPGKPPSLLPPGYATLIPAGSDLVFQMHYTANGKNLTDRSRVGFVFAKSKPDKRVIRIAAFSDGFTIPPGASDYKVSGSATLGTDCELIEVAPHMHLRGKSMALSATYPTGEHESFLDVRNYDFSWQLDYRFSKPRTLPTGTVLEADGSFDNSPNNRFNPNPAAEVRWGDQSWQEMMIGFFRVAIPAGTDPRTVVVRKK